MSDPHSSGGVSVTLKEDGREGTWLVFHGAVQRVREDILTAFGWEQEESLNSLSLDDLRREASKAYKASSNAARVLGATATTDKAEGKPAWQGSSAWDKARTGEVKVTNGPTEPEVNPLIGAIEAVTSVEDLRKLYARNEAEFKADADLLGQWKAKGKALNGAAA